MACILLWSSAVRVHDSQAYRKMDVTRERISRILELAVPSWSSKGSVVILSRDMLEGVGESRHLCQTPIVVSNQFPMLLLKRTALVALLYRFLMTQVRFVLLHVCPQSCTQNCVEGLLEVYEDVVEVLLVLEMFLTENAQVEDLLCGAPSCSQACLFFSDDLLRLWLQSVQYDLQHDFSLVTDEADRSVVLALLQVAFLGRCDD